MEHTLKRSYPLLLVIFLVSLVMPPEFVTNIAGLRLTPYRVILLVFTVPLLIKLLYEPRYRLNVIDGLVFMHCLWVVMSFYVNHGAAYAVESGGIYFVESFGAYLFGRVLINSLGNLAVALKVLYLILIFLFIFVIPEMLFGKNLIRIVSSTMTGTSFSSPIEPRFGLTRSYGVFDHPILLGVFAGGLLSIFYVYGQIRYRGSVRRFIPAILAVIVAVGSVSSGAIAALVSQGMMFAWDRICTFAKVGHRWAIFWSLFGIFFVLGSMLSNSGPIKVLLRTLTFSPGTAYNRLLIWEYGTEEVQRYPYFGIGLGDWQRPGWMSDSIDNFWLATAMRYGLPAFAFLALAIFLQLRAVRASTSSNEATRLLRQGYIYSMIGLIVVFCTVHAWNQIFVYFMFLIGLGTVLVGVPQQQPAHSRMQSLRGLQRPQSMATKKA